MNNETIMDALTGVFATMINRDARFQEMIARAKQTPWTRVRLSSNLFLLVAKEKISDSITEDELLASYSIVFEH